MFGPNEAPRLGGPQSVEIEAFLRSWDGAEPYALATVIHTAGATAAKAGARAVVKASGEVVGFVGGGCLRGALRKAGAAVIEAGEPRIIHVRPDGAEVDAETEAAATLGAAYVSRCPSQGRIGLFIEPVAPKPLLVIFGDGAVAHWVREFGVSIGLNAQFARDVDIAGGAAGRGLAAGFVVVATQGQGDAAALQSAFQTACPHIFFVASPKKAAHWRAKLAADGVAPAAMTRLRAPAGLDLGGYEAAEIAVAIIAEAIQLRRQGAAALNPARELEHP
ncbi:MAG: XdhC family protein [Neomegalonema sp.]|nr:XdhC family protein [Neomegalonema sp.]